MSSLILKGHLDYTPKSCGSRLAWVQTADILYVLDRRHRLQVLVMVRALKPLQTGGFIISQAEGARSAIKLSLSAQGTAKLREAEGHWPSIGNRFQRRQKPACH
jgi:hypothetical protein